MWHASKKSIETTDAERLGAQEWASDPRADFWEDQKFRSALLRQNSAALFASALF
jgi:hypothetical protein